MLHKARIAAAVLGAALIASTGFAGPVQLAVTEYKLRSAMLFKIGKFVEWPADAFDGAQAPMLLCVVGAELVAREFKALEQQKHGNRSITVRRMQGDTTDLHRCHILYFQEIDVADLTYTLRKLHGLPVLAVGESKEFLDAGGSIALMHEAGRITFAVNNSAAKANGLRVNSQLLHIADRMKASQ